MSETILRWRFKAEKRAYPNMWSFGICLTRSGAETYLYISLWKRSICIGKMYMKDWEWEEVDE